MNIFQLADNDQAQQYLGMIFGNVGIALTGSGSSILGNMFKTFNTILLVIGTFFIVYITVVGVLTSAHEGEFMKKWNSLWTPLRMLIGIVALFPTNSGYCAIQVVMMWLILQGVGAADMVWKTTVDYVANGGSLNPPASSTTGTSQGDPSQSTAAVVGFKGAMQNLFGDIVCQSALAKFTVTTGTNQYGDEKAVGHSDLVSPTKYQFGEIPIHDGQKALCGNLDWSQANADSTAKIGSDAFNAYALQQGLSDAYTSIVPVFEGIADAYVKSIIDDPNCWPGAQSCKGLPGETCWFGKYNAGPDLSQSACSINNKYDSGNPNADPAWNAVNSYAGSNFYLAASQLFAGYANNYVANAAVAAKADQKGSQTSQDIGANYTNAENNGWIFAGAYYYYMAYNVNQNQDAINNFYSAVKVDSIESLFNDSDNKYPVITQQFYCGNPGQNDTGKCTTSNPGGGARGIVNVAYSQMNAHGGGGVITSGGGGPAGDTITGVGASIISTWMNNLTGSNSQQNPIVNIQYFGKSCLIAAEVLFWVFFAVVIGLGVAQTMFVVLGTTVNPVAGVASAILVYFIPVVFFFILYLITIGGLLGVYVPLLPFTIFTFGAIGWFTAVIEAMVAAPIIALGILSPGGQHEILGRAEHSALIVLNVIMRPTLMIFGMVAAMLLSYVVIYLINGAFLSVVNVISGSGQGHKGMGLLEGFLFIMAYAGMVVTALSKCFELIHVIPSKALRYIGGQVESYGEMEAAEKVRGAVSAGGEAAGGAARGVGGKGEQDAGSLAKQHGEENREERKKGEKPGSATTPPAG